MESGVGFWELSLASAGGGRVDFFRLLEDPGEKVGIIPQGWRTFFCGKKVFSTNNSKIQPKKSNASRHVGLIFFFAGWVVKFWGDFSNERDDFRISESEEKSRLTTTNKRKTTIKTPRDFEDSGVL